MDSVYVATCDLGRGLFAGRNYAPGDEILRFKGPIIPLAEVQAKGKDQSNPIQVGNAEYIDIEPPGVFANHSCEPNAGITNNVDLIALQAIERGKEVRFDYSTTMWEGSWTMPCLCNSTQCRRIVRDFLELPIELQARYIALGIVQEFILRRLRLGDPAKLLEPYLL